MTGGTDQNRCALYFVGVNEPLRLKRFDYGVLRFDIVMLTLTYDGGGDESGRGIGRRAAREQRVEQVLRARQRDHGVRRREDHPQ